LKSDCIRLTALAGKRFTLHLTMKNPWYPGAALALFLIPGASFCAAADYPSRPIRLIAPFAPGGGVDVSARFIAKQLTESFGQTAIVDNRPGAGSTLGTDLVAKAAPDGHTLLVTHNAIAINQSLYPKLPYDTVRDFTQVAFIGVTTFTLVVNPALPVKNVKDLIALAKAKPGALNYASTGAGGGSHLATEYFMLATGTQLLNVPYKGTAPALTDLVSGQTHVMLSGLPGTVPFIKSKRILALATTSSKRSIFLPELPTLLEAGVDGYEFDAWYGMHAPAKTPGDIIRKLHLTVTQALTSPDVRQQLMNQGIEPRDMSPAAFSAFVRREVEKCAKIIKASGARAEL
jgi:tripartite-type tricarboxylate transporter receptor subunit TctC